MMNINNINNNKKLKKNTKKTNKNSFFQLIFSMLWKWEKLRPLRESIKRWETCSMMMPET